MTLEGFVPARQLRTISMGIPLERAATVLPQGIGDDIAIFNIVGGRVLMTSIIGEVTVLFGNAVLNMGLEENPTDGTVELICAVLACNDLPVGDLVSITGDPGDAMVPAADGGVPGMRRQGVVLRVGVLDWTVTGTEVGEMSWQITYIPIDDGAYMTVA